jgi:hypothetical protein
VKLNRREILALPFAASLLAQEQNSQTAIARYRGVHSRMFMEKAQLGGFPRGRRL